MPRATREAVEAGRKFNVESRQGAPAAGTPPETLPARAKRSTRKARVRRKGDDLSVEFRLLCKQSGLPMPVTEHVFHPTRKWRMDFAWLDEKVYLECDGAIWTMGRHTRGSGWFRDTEKINSAAALGWRLMRASPATLCTAETIDLLRQALTTKQGAAA